jgi:SAM-dependent methyltransferase
MNPVFSEEQFKRYLDRHKEKLSFYKKFIPGKKIIELGCGFGYSSVPLSALGFEVTSVDKDHEVLLAIRENAKKYGKNMKVVESDIFQLKELYKKDSFDACISGGLLEHFNIEEIRKLIEIQLYLAPVVIADIPIHSDKLTLMKRYSDYDKKICTDGVFRNLWDEDYWVNEVLSDYKVAYSSVSLSSKNTGNFEKLTLVIIRR